MNRYNNRIIGLCGYEGAGKDTVAKIIAEIAHTTDNPVEIIHFADALKNIVAQAFPVPRPLLRIDESGNSKNIPYSSKELAHILQSRSWYTFIDCRQHASPQSLTLAQTYTKRPSWRVPNTPRALLIESAAIVQAAYGVDYFLDTTRRIIESKPQVKFIIPDFRFAHEFAWANEVQIPLVGIENEKKQLAPTFNARCVVNVPWRTTEKARAWAVRGVATWWKHL